MKPNMRSLSIAAGAAALLALSACQTQESPAEAATAETGESKPQSKEQFLASEGHKATAEELARFMANQKLSPASQIVPDAEAATPAPLAKSAALATCVVNFNSPGSLDVLTGDAYNSLVPGPYYYQICNGNQFVYTKPLYTNQYRLIPEAADWCPSPPNYIGHNIGGVCQQLNQAIYFPRVAGNVGGNTGIGFNVKNQFNTPKNFDLQAIYVNSGTLEVWGNRPGIGWWVWYPLTAPGRWYWPAGTTVSELQVFRNGQNGTFTFDNLEIAVNP